MSAQGRRSAGREGSVRGELARRLAEALAEDAGFAHADRVAAPGAPADMGGAGPRVRPIRAGDRLLVALSGGLDSTVLLHLLRFAPELPRFDLAAAHFDHAMRPESAADARWVAGLCLAWGVPLRAGRAQAELRSEADARRARYAFLSEAARGVGADHLLTAHHADDQAETVLYRMLRGSGTAGLRGIAAARLPALRRPLLGFWREELEAYAEAVGLSWREDASNRRLDLARNALRHRILPDLERSVAPGARRALVRLAEHARQEEEGWASVLPGLVAPLLVEESAAMLVLDREGLARLHPAVRARVLRALVHRLGGGLDAAATRRAVDFVERGASGARLQLGGRLELARELDHMVIAAAAPSVRPGGATAAAVSSAATARPVPPDRSLRIPDATPGSGAVVLGGRALAVAWGGEGVTEHPAHAWFATDRLRFPLVVRGRRPGDRIRLEGHTRKLKKVLLEARVPLRLRGQLPVVVDAADEVLWVPGLIHPSRTGAGSDAPVAGALGIGVG